MNTRIREWSNAGEVYDSHRRGVKSQTKCFVQQHRRGAGGYHAGVITLGIDPGTAICGFGVVELRDGSVRMIDAGCIRTPSDASDAERLRQLHGALRTLIGEHRPERVGIERLFFQRNVQTAMTVGHAKIWRMVRYRVRAGIMTIASAG